jgi:hypothetical protein
VLRDDRRYFVLGNGADILDRGHRIPPCALNFMNARIDMIGRDRRLSGECLHFRRDIGEASAGSPERAASIVFFVILSQ